MWLMPLRGRRRFYMRIINSWFRLAKKMKQIRKCLWDRKSQLAFWSTSLVTVMRGSWSLVNAQVKARWYSRTGTYIKGFGSMIRCVIQMENTLLLMGIHIEVVLNSAVSSQVIISTDSLKERVLWVYLA